MLKIKKKKNCKNKIECVLFLYFKCKGLIKNDTKIEIIYITGFRLNGLNVYIIYNIIIQLWDVTIIIYNIIV